MTNTSSPLEDGSKLNSPNGIQFLNKDTEVEFDGISKLACMLTTCSTSLIYFFEDTKAWIKSSYGNKEGIKSTDLDYSIGDIDVFTAAVHRSGLGQGGERQQDMKITLTFPDISLSPAIMTPAQHLQVVLIPH